MRQTKFLKDECPKTKTQEEMGNLNSPTSIREFKFIVKKPFNNEKSRLRPPH